MAVVSVKRSIINKVSNSRERPLLSIMHRVKPSSYENMKGVHVKSIEYIFPYEYMQFLVGRLLADGDQAVDVLSIYQQCERVSLSISYNYFIQGPISSIQFSFFVYNVSLNVLRPFFSGFIIAIIHLIPHGNSITLLLKTSGFTNCQSLQEQCSHRILGGGGGMKKA